MRLFIQGNNIPIVMLQLLETFSNERILSRKQRLNCQLLELIFSTDQRRKGCLDCLGCLSSELIKAWISVLLLLSSSTIGKQLATSFCPFRHFRAATTFLPREKVNADNKMMNPHRQQINGEERLKPSNFFISFITVRFVPSGLEGQAERICKMA